MRADFQAYYGLDLDDLGEGLRVMRAADLAAHLPRDSVTWMAVHPENAWGVQEHLLATIADTLRWLAWAKSEDGKRNRKRPKPIPRPGDSQDDRGRFSGVEKADLDEVKRLLALPRR
ncbi:DUF5361 domain-containing protein [Jonesia denitrificans]|nr:DUF5361 domain-containing protein [Jonesia denitrificans]QXB43414.1 DUF5361 domain-containing protein [Jonesia denitrificans]